MPPGAAGSIPDASHHTTCRTRRGQACDPDDPVERTASMMTVSVWRGERHLVCSLRIPDVTDARHHLPRAGDQTTRRTKSRKHAASDTRHLPDAIWPSASYRCQLLWRCNERRPERSSPNLLSVGDRQVFARRIDASCQLKNLAAKSCCSRRCRVQAYREGPSPALPSASVGWSQRVSFSSTNIMFQPSRRERRFHYFY